MGRHDLTLGIAIQGRAGLVSGIYASTPVLTATGWLPVQEVTSGDLLVTRDLGLLPVIQTRQEPRAALWGVHIPAGALGNEGPVTLPPGQPVLVETEFALPHAGASEALLPATALEGWRGIAPLVLPGAEPICQLRLSRPALVQAGPGLALGVEGADTDARDLIAQLLYAPMTPILPLAAARHLVATLIAEETGHHLRQTAYAALSRPKNRA